jgi:ABC-2 type transport system ATP-binding protein
MTANDAATVNDMAGDVAIETHDLRRSFGEVRALCGIDLRVEAGTILGLLGPNGAGKTTAVRILTTLLPPSGGTATVDGLDVVGDAARLRERIGLAGQYAAVDENLTGFENLEMVGRLYHMGRGPSRERAEELLERFDLAGAGQRLVNTYSGGMRRRLDLAAALVARPPVLFLDEPTTGLDPRSRLSLWEVIEARVAAGTTVLLTTQYLDEADRLADRIAVIDHGTLIAEGSSDELKDRVGGERLEVKLEDPAQAQSAIGLLADLADEEPSVDDGVVAVTIRERHGVIADAVRRLDGDGIGIEDIAIRRPTLDDVFLTLTGKPPEAEQEVPEQEREEMAV